MIVFKGFHGNLTCTMGAGTYKYKIGKTEKTQKAKTANSGFHSTREPFGILQYYGNFKNDAFCVCEAGGDINEDADGRVASTELTPMKRLTPTELALYEAAYIEKHPDFETKLVDRDRGRDNGHFAIVRGKDPVAYGKRGTTIILIQEQKSSRRIKRIAVYEIAGKNRPGWYGTEGRRDAKGRVKEA